MNVTPEGKLKSLKGSGHETRRTDLGVGKGRKHTTRLERGEGRTIARTIVYSLFLKEDY